MKAFLYWSGGKDAALALHKARQQGIDVEALVTTMNSTVNRNSMHGVRRELIERQAASIGLPLYTVELPEMPGMNVYEEASRQVHKIFANEGFTHAVFGDIFLEDLKAYRENLLLEDGLHCLFPLWKENTKSLLRSFVHDGFKGLVVCVNSAVLPKAFCGRLLDENFAADLPPDVDACGENGEYHSFVFDGPVFSKPITIEKAEIVFKEYPAPVIDSADNDCFTAPQPAAGFYFQDLVTA